MARSKPLPLLPVQPQAKNADKTSIGLQQVVDDDLAVTQMYQDLAIRHDALVTYVEAVLRKQENDK